MLAPILRGFQDVGEPRPFYDIIRRQGLCANLRLCLDAADPRSFDGSGQSWNDRSEQSSPFFRGASASVTTDDPSFGGATAGVAGKASDYDYLKYDGGDFNRYSAANAAWMERLHKAGAKWTFLAWIYLPSPSATQGIFGAVPTAENGIQIITLSSAFRLFVGNAGAGALNVSSATVLPDSTQQRMFSVSVDEAAGVGLWGKDDVFESFTSTYTSPSAGATSVTYEIGAVGSAGAPLAANSRIYQVAMWEGRALRQGELLALFHASRRRYPPFRIRSG